MYRMKLKKKYHHGNIFIVGDFVSKVVSIKVPGGYKEIKAKPQLHLDTSQQPCGRSCGEWKGPERSGEPRA